MHKNKHNNKLTVSNSSNILVCEVQLWESHIFTWHGFEKPADFTKTNHS